MSAAATTPDSLGWLASRAQRRRLALTALALLCVAAALHGLLTGPLPMSGAQVLSSLGSGLGLPAIVPVAAHEQASILDIRLPRILLALACGAVLGVSGAAMQGLFRNPLAEPGLIGVSSGAALAAASVIVLGTRLPGLAEALPLPWLAPLAAFGGGLLAALFANRLAGTRGQLPVTTLLLAGIAINALAGAGIGLLTHLADDAALRSLTFWMLGSLGKAGWSEIGAALPLILVPVLLIPRMARALNALLLGESEAAHLGVEVERVKRQLLWLVAMGVGAAVALAGIIGFVGLVIPHLLRLTLGPDHRGLLPGSALLGAALLVVADSAARTWMAPAELPVGILTTLVGGPFFLWLLMRKRAADLR